MPLAFGDFVFDPARRELRNQDATVKVDPQQLDLLACFLEHPGVLLSRQELIDQAWQGRAISDSALSVAVAKLRKVLRQASGSGEFIENRYGRGYRFVIGVTTVGAAPRVSEPPLPLPLPAAGAPLVGRADPLKKLDLALQRMLQGEGQLCALIGQPGIGKTRLAESLEELAHQRGARSAWGRFSATEDTPPLWPFIQLLRELNVDGLADDALHSLVERAGHAGAPATPGSSELTQPFLQDASSAIHRTIDELTRTLVKLSQRQPIVLVLDDLQWADAATLRLLNYLSSELPRWPIMVLVTLRATNLGAEDARSRELLRLLSDQKCVRIELERLHEADIAAYIGATFGDQRPELGSAVFARSEGNPFFMVELLRPFQGLALPEPAQLRFSGLALDLVRQRLATLPTATRVVLAAAAVIGHDFDLGLLGHVVEHSPDKLLEALDSSLANDTIVASARVPGAYAFDHELIREVLYADLSAIERCRLHLRVGEGLSRRRDVGVDVPSAELAHHFLAALPQGRIDVAIAHARSAAIASMRMAAHSDARALLRRALDALKFGLEPNPETLTALLLELSMVERLLGDAANIEHLMQGVALARKHRFGALLTIAGQMLSPGPGLLARTQSRAVLEAAAEVLPADDYTRRAIVTAHLAWTPPDCFSARKVAALLAEADRLAAASNDANARATVRTAHLFFDAGPSHQAAGEALADEIDRELRQNPETMRSTRLVATATFRLIIALQRGDKPGLQHALEQRQAVLSRLNNSELNWHQQRMLLVLRMNRGEFAGIGAELQQLTELAQRLRLQALGALWARDYGELMVWTDGELSTLGARVRPGLALTDRESPTTLARKLRSMVEFGFLEDARAGVMQLSRDALHDLPQDRDYLAVLCQLALASAATGAREQSAVLYELLAPYPQLYAADVSSHCMGSVSHFLGLLARALGEHEAARDHFTHAAARNTEFELKAWALKSQYELAMLLRDEASVRDPHRASELFAHVHARALELGLVPLARASAT